MSARVERIVVLGNTLTALAIVRHCRHLGLPCVLLHRDAGPACDSRLAHIVDVSDASDTDILERLTGLAREGPSALVADSDGWLRWLAKHREQVDDAFDCVLHPNNDALALCLNKTRFLQWCADQGLAAPRVYPGCDVGALRAGWQEVCGALLRDMPLDPTGVEFPLLVRPRETRHGSNDNLPKAIEIDNPDQLRALLDRYREAGAEPNISQSLLRPRIRQYSVGLARNARAQTAIMVCEKVRPSAEMCSGGTYVVARPDPDVRAFAKNTVERLDYFGIAEIEILKDMDTGEQFLIEINARPWVQYSLSWRSGFDLLTLLIDPDAYDATRERPSKGAWLHFSDDLYAVFSRSEGMRSRGKLTLAGYVLSLLSVRTFAVWSWRDPWPMIAGLLRRLRARHRRGR